MTELEISLIHLEISLNELEISLNELEISLNELEISLNELEISLNELEISLIHLEISLIHYGSKNVVGLNVKTARHIKQRYKKHHSETLICEPGGCVLQFGPAVLVHGFGHARHAQRSIFAVVCRLWIRYEDWIAGQ